MTKNKFICPCCGLPNHLEFQNKEDYDSYLNNSTDELFKVKNNNGQFDNYVLQGGETEKDRREEIQKRFNLINKYSKKYYSVNEETGEEEPINFADWFKKEVAGFYFQTMLCINKVYQAEPAWSYTDYDYLNREYTKYTEYEYVKNNYCEVNNYIYEIVDGDVTAEDKALNQNVFKIITLNIIKEGEING